MVEGSGSGVVRPRRRSGSGDGFSGGSGVGAGGAPLGPGVGEYVVGDTVGAGRVGEDGVVSGGVVFIDGSRVVDDSLVAGEDGVLRRGVGRPVGDGLPGLPGVQVVADGSKRRGSVRELRGPRDKGRERLRVTQRDVELFKFLARYKYATVGQIARFFGTGRKVWERRLPRLNRAGLIWWAWGAAARPKLWLVSREGLMFAGLELGVAKVSWGQLRHTLGLVDLGIGFERGAGSGSGGEWGEVVVTERELRASVSRKTLALRDGVGVGPTDRVGFALELFNEGWGARFGGVGSTGQLVRAGYTVPVGRRRVSELGSGVGVAGSVVGHIPDMVVLRKPLPNGASGCLAVELELTRKTVPQYEKIIRAYTEWEGYSQCIYYCVDRGIARTLSSVVAMVPGAREKVRVMLFEPVEDAASPGRTKSSARLRPALYPRLKTGMLLPVVPEQDRQAGLWDAAVGGRPPGEDAGAEGVAGTGARGARFDDDEPFSSRDVGVGSGSGVPAVSPFSRTTYDKLAMADKEREDMSREMISVVKAQVKAELMEEMRRKLESEGAAGLARAVEDDDGEGEWVEDESFMLEEEDEDGGAPLHARADDGEGEWDEVEDDEVEDEDDEDEDGGAGADGGAGWVGDADGLEDWDEEGNLRVVKSDGVVRPSLPSRPMRRVVRPRRPGGDR